MKTLIVFTTTHGCTEKCANLLQQHLNGGATVVNLKNAKSLDLAGYDTIIIGGSIHAGRIQKRIQKFCQENLEQLKPKKLGLFICCMEEGATAEKQLQTAFPEALIQHATAQGLFGGEFNFEKMNFFEKAIVKKIAKIDQSVSKINSDRIAAFARQLQEKGK